MMWLFGSLGREISVVLSISLELRLGSYRQLSGYLDAWEFGISDFFPDIISTIFRVFRHGISTRFSGIWIWDIIRSILDFFL
ncbi:unnamed protein product [Rhizophagus irregularis]|nr:unnamed protein product [Rhizophagus irregularis]CAB4429584.1 unnamed protein product [Rhizophagus irregularis]CAB4436230.1 unnamed protein product [Rhizophagus irregularis]